jgi:hypothetical protein
MIIPPTSFVPDAEIERKSLSLLREHEGRIGARVQLPVPIDDIIEKTLGLHVTWLEIEEDANEIILARIDPSFHGHPTVQMNERRLNHFEAYFGTEAYSKAHEAGHWVLHLGRGQSTQLSLGGSFSWELKGRLLCRRLDNQDRREFQAERFAAFLLLPEHLLRPAIHRLYLTRWSVINELALHCGVSKTAMRKRLEQIGEILVGPEGQLAVPSKTSSEGGFI